MGQRAIRRAIALSGQLRAQRFAAPLADFVFRPAMSAEGALAPLLSALIGVEANRGIGLLISTFGLPSAAVTVVAFFSKTVRNVALDLPDHVAGPELGRAATLIETAD